MRVGLMADTHDRVPVIAEFVRLMQEAGVAMLPVTFCMLFLASRFGALGTRIGPRIPMTAGPLVMGVGTLMLVPQPAEEIRYNRIRAPRSISIPFSLRSMPVS